MRGTYKCAVCGGVFETTEELTEEANKEAERLWSVKGASERADMAVVCDDCFKKGQMDRLGPNRFLPEVVK